MSTGEFLSALRTRWPYVLVTFLLGAVAMGTWSFLTPPTYKATATDFFSLQVGSDVNAGQLYQGSNYTQNLLASYADLATKQIVLEPVIEDLKLDTSVSELASKIDAVTASDTVLIDIVVTDGSPTRAAAMANGVAAQLSKTVHDLSVAGGSSGVAVNGHTVQEASPPKYAAAPKTRRNVIIGAFGGLLIGIALALGRERLDTRVRGEKDIPPGEVLLGAVPFDGGTSRAVVAAGSERVTQSESLRRLRTALQFVDVDSPVRVIEVTSSVESEGKTTVSVNLAAVFAEADLKVLLIDADLRRPQVSRALDIEGSVGLTNVLAGQIDLDDALQTWGSPAVRVLPSGSIPPNPSELLGSSHMADLVTTMRQRFDIVIIDTPPLLPVTDPAVVSAHSDGVIMVARHGKVRRAQLAEATQTLHSVDARILGIVLNMIPKKAFGGRYDYYQQDDRQTTDGKAAQKIAGKSARDRGKSAPSGVGDGIPSAK